MDPAFSDHTCSSESGSREGPCRHPSFRETWGAEPGRDSPAREGFVLGSSGPGDPCQVATGTWCDDLVRRPELRGLERIHKGPENAWCRGAPSPARVQTASKERFNDSDPADPGSPVSLDTRMVRRQEEPRLCKLLLRNRGRGWERDRRTGRRPETSESVKQGARDRQKS